jgi:hypothetical protein
MPVCLPGVTHQGIQVYSPSSQRRLPAGLFQLVDHPPSVDHTAVVEILVHEAAVRLDGGRLYGKAPLPDALDDPASGDAVMRDCRQMVRPSRPAGAAPDDRALFHHHKVQILIGLERRAASSSGRRTGQYYQCVSEEHLDQRAKQHAWRTPRGSQKDLTVTYDNQIRCGCAAARCRGRGSGSKG